MIPAGRATSDDLTKIFHADDLLPLYQSKGKGLEIPPLNRDLKRAARGANQETLDRIQDYCRNNIDNNYYLQMANKHVKDIRNTCLYFDFYYLFLYCQTPKVRVYY